MKFNEGICAGAIWSRSTRDPGYASSSSAPNNKQNAVMYAEKDNVIPQSE